jgi:dTDP-4-amino-4,6-dideoxygalactose transaminase
MTVRAGHIPFNRAYVTCAEFDYMREAIENAHLAGNGPFSMRCCEWLEREIGSSRALLTHSCTGALEMAFTLADIGPGDEVIMPSFTFVSVANAVVARGGVPVFVDVRRDTFCLDETLIEAAVTERAKAVVPVHYAGVACDMASINGTAERHNLVLIEDAAHAIQASVNGQALGGLGDLATLSFHETKNVSCGEGGALLVNDDALVERAEIIHEKGTDRQRFFRGLVDKYTWVDVGSSYALSDLAAAYLWAQLEHSEAITAKRRIIWDRYHEAFAGLEANGELRRPIVPLGCVHNAHMYYVVVDELATRTRLIDALAAHDINAVFHFVPLHDSVGGRQYGRIHGELDVTSYVADRLLRLPLWAGMTAEHVDRVIDGVYAFFGVQSAFDGPLSRDDGSAFPQETDASRSSTPDDIAAA